MAYTQSRFGSTLAVLLLASTAFGGTAQAGWFFGESKKDAKTESSTQGVKASTEVKPAETLDGNIRQAQLMRVDGNYSEAIRHLSQMMMVASDDPRVISEYGKTLAAMGRAQEAVNFLTRAQQLQPGDWSVHSALGVAYDQLGKQPEAMKAYEQALAIKPGEVSVLSNYALSRMLANDPDGAQKLVARAEIAGGASDTKIARNIAMIRELAPQAASDADYAVTKAAPAPAPRTAVAAATLPTPPAPVRAASIRSTPLRTASVAPRPVQPAPFIELPTPPAPEPAPQNTAMIEAQPQMAQAPAPIVPQGVVMQRVPEDPLAGPVNFAIPRPPVATRAPRSLTAPRADVARAPAQATPTPVKAAAAAPVAKNEPPRKTASNNAASDLQARAEAIAKQMDAEKASNAKQATAKPAPQPVKAAAAPAPVKAAEAKPATPAKPVATAANTHKHPVPALRLSASAF